MAWEDILVNSKILGHISAGVYRSAGGALKELVSNAFDANATKVTITTNWPSFDVITCRDNGSGMTLNDFRRIMQGGIGESLKRTKKDFILDFDRPIIGWLGIGMLAIAQICHEFKIVSHHRETKTAFQATVKLVDFLKEKVDTTTLGQNDNLGLDVGQFDLEKIDYDEYQVGTYIIAADMRSAFVRKFRETPGEALPSNFSSFLESIHSKRSIKELGDYWQMVWELAISCPIPYIEGGPFEWKQIEPSYELQKSLKGLTEQEAHKKLTDLVQHLKNFQFETIVDGLSLRKPNIFPYPALRYDKEPMSGHLFLIDEEIEVYGRLLKLFGYIYMQDGQAIEPMEIRGLLIRIKNVAIGNYDPTFLKYPKIEGPRFNWLSSELYIEVGLEQALNIDRDSFNEIHPHFVKVQQLVHSLLEKVFVEASKGTKERSKIKQQDEQIKKMEAIESLLELELESNFEFIDTKEDQKPLAIDLDKKKIIINDQSPLWPRSKNKRELAQIIGIAFEISMLAPEPERRERFYKLLTQILDT